MYCVKLYNHVHVYFYILHVDIHYILCQRYKWSVVIKNWNIWWCIYNTYVYIFQFNNQTPAYLSAALDDNSIGYHLNSPLKYAFSIRPQRPIVDYRWWIFIYFFRGGGWGRGRGSFTKPVLPTPTLHMYSEKKNQLKEVSHRGQIADWVAMGSVIIIPGNSIFLPFDYRQNTYLNKGPIGCINFHFQVVGPFEVAYQAISSVSTGFDYFSTLVPQYCCLIAGFSWSGHQSLHFRLRFYCISEDSVRVIVGITRWYS